MKKFLKSLAFAAAGLVLAGSTAHAAVVWVAPHGPGGTYVGYSRNNTALTFAAAQAAANGLSVNGKIGNLASVNSAAENDFVGRYLGAGWIGLTDDAGFGGGPEGGNTSGLVTPVNAVPVAGQRGSGFRWVDGTSFTRSFWNAGEPNDAGGENFIEMVNSPTLNNWNDLPAAFTRPSNVRYASNSATVQGVKPTGFVVSVYHAVDGDLEGTIGGGPGGDASREMDGLLSRPGIPGTVVGSATIASFGAGGLNFQNEGGSSGNFGSDVNFPGLPLNSDQALVRATGTMSVAATGNYVFRINGDDGGRLTIDGQRVIVDNGLHGPTDANSVTLNLTAGSHTFEYLQFERGGGYAAELAYDNQAITPGTFVIAGSASTEGITFNGTVDTFKMAGGHATNSLANANLLVTGQRQLSEPVVQGIADTVNMADGGTGQFGSDDSFLGVTGDNYVMTATGIIKIPTSGAWTFGTNTDDGSALVLTDLAGNVVFTKLDDVLAGPHDHLATANLSAGYYKLGFLFFEAGGGAEAELYAQQGTFGAFNAGFRLLGDPALGIQVFSAQQLTDLPEPGTYAIGGLTLLVGAGYGWKKRRAVKK